MEYNFSKNLVGSIKRRNTGEQPLDIRLILLIYFEKSFLVSQILWKFRWAKLCLAGVDKFSIWFLRLVGTITDHLGFYQEMKVRSYQTFLREGNNHFVEDIHITHHGCSNTQQPLRVETVLLNFKRNKIN